MRAVRYLKDAKRRVRQGLDDLALELNCLFF